MDDIIGIDFGEDGLITVLLPNGASIELPELRALGISPFGENPHDYNQNSEVGFTRESRLGINFGDFPVQAQAATVENAFMALRHKPAPSLEFLQSGVAVNHGDVSSIPVIGDVEHYVYPELRVLINVTIEGHWLHPGIVVNYVYEESGQIYIARRGVGNGDFAWWNEKLAPPAWDIQDTDIQRLLNIYGENPIPEEFDWSIDDFGHIRPADRMREGKGGSELVPGPFGLGIPLERHEFRDTGQLGDGSVEDLQTTEAMVAAIVRADAGGHQRTPVGSAGRALNGRRASDGGKGWRRDGFGGVTAPIDDRPGLTAALQAMSTEPGKTNAMMEPLSDFAHRTGESGVFFQVPSSEIVYLRDRRPPGRGSRLRAKTPLRHAQDKIRQRGARAELGFEKPVEGTPKGASVAADPDSGVVRRTEDSDRAVGLQKPAGVPGEHRAGKTGSAAPKRSAEARPGS